LLATADRLERMGSRRVPEQRAMSDLSTIRELGRLSQIPVDVRAHAGGFTTTADPEIIWGHFSSYVRLGGERIWIRVYRGQIVAAEAPPDFGQPNVNRKWIAGSGPVGIEAGALLRRATVADHF
jgi:hypothetical protein